MVLQALEIVKIGVLFPFFSVAYIIAPHCVVGQTMRKPFIKFICHSASYFTFLCEYFPLLLLLLLLLFSFYIRFFTLFPHSLPLLSSVSHLVTDLLLLPVRLLKLNRTWFTTSSSFFFFFFFASKTDLEDVRARACNAFFEVKTKVYPRLRPDLVSFTSLVFYLSARERIKHRLLNSLQIPPANTSHHQ